MKEKSGNVMLCVYKNANNHNDCEGIESEKQEILNYKTERTNLK